MAEHSEPQQQDKLTPEPYWCHTAPNVPRVFSASSLATLAECARKFELRYIEGWSPKGENLNFEFGTAFHNGMEAYWITRISGTSKEDALHEAIIAAQSTPLSRPIKNAQLGKTQLGLTRALVTYVDTWDDDPSQIAVINNKPALEVPFRFFLPLTSPDGDNFSVRGYIDQIRHFAGSLTALDHKTTAKAPTDWYFSGFEINFQNAIYSASMRIMSKLGLTNFLIDAVAVLPNGDVELGRKPISLTTGEVDEGLNDIMEYIRLSMHFAQRNYWPKNPASCKMCEFREVCKTDPKLRINVLESNFVEKKRVSINEER